MSNIGLTEWEVNEIAAETKAMKEMKAMSQPAIMQYFTYMHLKGKLQATSQRFCALAEQIVVNVPDNAERDVALRKLLEAKDAAVRAMITKQPTLAEGGE